MIGAPVRNKENYWVCQFFIGLVLCLALLNSLFDEEEKIVSFVVGMPPKAKLTDLWSEDNGTRAITKPQPVKTSESWYVPAEAFTDKVGPRRRPVHHQKPNLRDAVAIPAPGQSYNPSFESHQETVSTVVKKLNKKKKSHEKLVDLLSLGKDQKVVGNFSADKTWDEEVKDQPKPKAKKAASSAAAEDRKKKRKKQKKGKKETERAAKHALPHRRHPDRNAAVKQTDGIDEIAAEVNKKVQKRERTAQKKKEARKAGQQIKSFGRYHHTPLVPDVAPTDKLVGSLRHMTSTYTNPLTERVKSLEERNIIPARMRHQFNKRKILKPKGEVRIKREAFGIMPETSH